MLANISSKIKNIKWQLLPLNTKRFQVEIDKAKKEVEFVKNNMSHFFMIQNMLSNSSKIFSLKILAELKNGGGGDYPYEADIKFYLPNCLDDVVQGAIARSGDFFEIYNISKADKYLKDKANILDIGANIGNHSVYYAMVRKARKIHAFEPTRDVFEILCKNIELNSLQNIIKPHNIALGECDGKASIKERPAGNLGGTSLKADASGELIVKSLDELKFDEKIDFVKIDVEGFESQVLLGAKAFLAYHKPTIMIEIHRPKFKEVSEILDSLNYKLAEKLVSSVDFIYLPK